MSNSIHEHLLDVKSLDLNTNGQFILIPCVIRLPSELFIAKKKQMIEWYNVFVTNTILLFDRTHAHCTSIATQYGVYSSFYNCLFAHIERAVHVQYGMSKTALRSTNVKATDKT